MFSRLRRRTIIMLTIFAVFLAPLIARAAFYAVSGDARSWRDADWSSSGLLPQARDFQPARVVVFTGTTGAWKGVFSVHSWIVFKPAGARNWTRYDVVGWGNPLRANGWPADGLWYGNTPTPIADVTGAEAEKIIPKIEQAVNGVGSTGVREAACPRAAHVLRGARQASIAVEIVRAATARIDAEAEAAGVVGSS